MRVCGNFDGEYLIYFAEKQSKSDGGFVNFHSACVEGVQFNKMLGRVTSIGNTIQTSHKMQIELQFAKVLLVKFKSKNLDKM